MLYQIQRGLVDVNPGSSQVIFKGKLASASQKIL